MDKVNADQREVVCTRKVPILVLAGPGTGKTQTIVERIASLIQEGEKQSCKDKAIPLTTIIFLRYSYR